MKIGAIAGITFKEAKRDRVLYLLFFFAAPRHRRLPGPGRPDGRRPGQDHQGRRPGLDLPLRRPHGHPHRHGPRLQGDRQEDDLHPARQAPPPGRVHPGQVPRPRPDALRHDRGHDPDLPGHRLRPHAQDRGRPPRGRRLHLPRARPHHRRGHPLLLLLDAHPELALRPGLLSHRTPFLGPRAHHQEDAAGRGPDPASGASTSSCPTSRTSTSRRRSSTACPSRRRSISTSVLYGVCYTAFILGLAVLVFRRRDFI